MQWTDDTVLGIPIIDEGHRELFRRLHSLRAAIKKQVCRYTIEDMLAFLDEYGEVRFCEEEEYMKHYGYADYGLHKEEHDNFRTEVKFLRDELQNIRALGLKGSYELSVEAVQIVTDWIRYHVEIYDRKLGEFLRQRESSSIGDIASCCERQDHIVDDIATICAICRRIRNGKGLWKHKDNYTTIPPDILYSHSICAECLQMHYADLFAEKK